MRVSGLTVLVAILVVAPSLVGRALALPPMPERALTQAVPPHAAHLMRIVWPLAPDAKSDEANARLNQADALFGKIRNCKDFQRAAEDGSGLFFDLGVVPFDGMRPEIRAVAINGTIGMPTAGIREDDGVAVYVVCERE